jgi:hypothetical protein
VRADADDPWTAERLEAALAPFVERYGELPAFTPEARQAHRTRIDKDPAEAGGGRRWRVRHTLVDPEGEDFWAVEGVVDLASPDAFEGPLITLRAIGEG